MAYPIGTRVVRGPTWVWGEQDGGEGNVGVILGDLFTEKWQHVQWPSGVSFGYRTGDGFCDVTPAEIKPLEDFL